MRINRFVAQATGMSRRAADQAVAKGRVRINGLPAGPGSAVTEADHVFLDKRPLYLPPTAQTVVLNKPEGYVVSRSGQGSRTIYELLPPELQRLKPVGRLDKNSSGLLLLTTDGELAHRLTHPGQRKTKRYEVTLSQPLTSASRETTLHGVPLDDGPSRFDGLAPLSPDGKSWLVTMHEGRNRQIRRTFAALGYRVTRLHRTQFGPYRLENLPIGEHRAVKSAILEHNDK